MYVWFSFIYQFCSQCGREYLLSFYFEGNDLARLLLVCACANVKAAALTDGGRRLERDGGRPQTHKHACPETEP
ncbi:hypothetical protein JOB18_005984 [Solea senegalensis]|uniref:Uncharacterized protein n=1 Tax=Solea senegalensis TaxID=28829 RepID=A0AAV6SWC2_SOLSE|nr:hypothetical protein JOB18_005984 [Solea senegalensis]